MATTAAHPALAPGNTAVVTGASSGIGLALAKKLRRLGLNVVMADINEPRLREAVCSVQCIDPPEPVGGERAAAGGGSGGADDDDDDDDGTVTVAGIPCDVADPKSVAALHAAVVAHHGGCHALFNNAGIGNGVNGALAPLEKWQGTMGVNFFGVLHGCSTFVPPMLASGRAGLVVNTGSKQGITFPPGNLAYNVSKAAVKAYAEGLEHELRNKEGGQTVNSFLLVPGWTWTPMTQRPGADPHKKPEGAWSPEQVVDFLFAKIVENEFYVICPDGETTEAIDNAKALWTGGDIPNRRPPLSRWHPDHSAAYAKFVEEQTANAAATAAAEE